MNQIADIKPDASSRRSPFFTEEHEMLRAQVRRFVERGNQASCAQWEKEGFVPRDVLRRMGGSAFSDRYPEVHGGAAMDTLGSVVLAEVLGSSTFSGVAITALVHTDMASVHVFNAGSEQQKSRDDKIVAGEAICAVAVTEPDAGSDVKAIRTTAQEQDGGYLLNGAKMFITNGVHADLYCVAAKTDGAGRAAPDHVSWLKRRRLVFGSAGRWTSTAGGRPTRPNCCLKTAWCLKPLLEKAMGSTRSCATFRTNGSSLARWRWEKRRQHSISRFPT